MALTNFSSTEPAIRNKIVAAGAWSHCSQLIAMQTKNQNSADDDIRLAACELMANLSLTEAIQQRAQLGLLNFEAKTLNQVLTFVRGKRPLTAILGFFANIQLVELPDNLTTNTFTAMASSDDDGVWHRALFIISEYNQKIKIETAKIRQELSRVASLTKSNEVRVLAQSI